MSKLGPEVTIQEIALFLTEQIAEFSQNSTRAILEYVEHGIAPANDSERLTNQIIRMRDHGSTADPIHRSASYFSNSRVRRTIWAVRYRGRIRKAFSRFSSNPDKERLRLKLHFHLFIANLAVVAVDLQVSDYFLPHSQQIIDGIVRLFYEAIKEGSKNIDGGIVIGDEFIKDPEERNIVLAELRRVAPVFGNSSGLPRMGLSAITDMLLEKRLNEYRVMWLEDMMRLGQEDFIALMPTRVYQHWSGDNPRSWESLSFSLPLSASLMTFSAVISKDLRMMRLKQ